MAIFHCSWNQKELQLVTFYRSTDASNLGFPLESVHWPTTPCNCQQRFSQMIKHLCKSLVLVWSCKLLLLVRYMFGVCKFDNSLTNQNIQQMKLSCFYCIFLCLTSSATQLTAPCPHKLGKDSTCFNWDSQKLLLFSLFFSLLNYISLLTLFFVSYWSLINKRHYFLIS